MRRLPVVTLTLLLLVMSLSASATGGTGNIKDKFTSISWSGSDGSLPWSGPWTEIGDDGDEKKGNVRVVAAGDCTSGNCMRMSALTTLPGDIGAVRGGDTSDLEDLELRFDFKATGSLLGSELEVEVFDGDEWETVKQYQWGSAFTDQPIIDIGDFSSEDFQVRFLFSGVLLSGEVFIDNVEIRGTLDEEETTTTTTTVPTTTTLGTTTTTKAPSTTTTTRAETTTSTSDPDSTAPTTSTTLAGPTTSTGTEEPGRGTGSAIGNTTSTTVTTTTIDGAAVGPGSGGDGTTPDGSGIRAAARGLQASFQGDLYGEVRTVSSLAGVDFDADYNMAVEVIEATWAWMVLLGLVVAYSIIRGIDRRRGRLDS